MPNKMGPGGNTAVPNNSVHGQIEEAINFANEHGGLHHTPTGDHRMHESHTYPANEERFNLKNLRNESEPVQTSEPSPAGLRNVTPIPNNDGGGRKEY